ncbi:MAG TPA: bifunctional 23S rRNA (guanine(2069)-N(7))-methyltransferase RlmK/23S rRNA (guanine(2445)-N(2))-methyltransferase RlmL [Polyangia bacterium]|jgi:23S rRNA (guanine2445-N2)-methyltransferase / 23S rRNA (guanine2069-N7)-methyltransferase|nr:bifunctional 23S rRNA (guanine(2069)-N(7))-methyltransferase RlmK/23S rRNA (guanine(2445)-N(2))-methyltransferase RlmL [Polyangia bacterium]
MSRLSYFVTAARGTEEVLAEELRALGALDVTPRWAGVEFTGSLEDGYRVCLWSRVASRVLLMLGRLDAPSGDALYEGVRRIDWSAHIDPRGTLAVDFTGTSAAITHTHFGALRTKDAIVDQLREQHGARPSIDTARPAVRVHVHLEEESATVSLDLAGEALHRRGYRTDAGAAPLRETLAAAILLLGDWPRLAAAGAPLMDPMCGSGTLVIEAALMATDRAPGLGRDYFGFLGWRGHDAALWARLCTEARERARRGQAGATARILGHDIDAAVLRLARANVARAGLGGRVELGERAIADAAPPEDLPARGLLVTNPPYGERLGETAALPALYRTLGDVLKRRFAGWRALVLTGERELAKQVGLRPSRRWVLYNGAIECRLLEYPLDETPPKDAEGPHWRRPRPPSPEVEGFKNRLRKNLRHLGKWARRDGVSCYRVYDADLPEYAVAVDLYEDAAHVQEYAPPATVDAARAAARLSDALAVLPEVLGIRPEVMFVKVRRRQRGLEQYERQAAEGAWREVREGGLRFLVNLSEYLDTGLFLDHRRLRALLREWAAGREFLNLYAYTGTASVYAAAGGARSTTSVDLSNTYLDWAGRNFALNGLDERRHRRVRADCLEFLGREQRRYGLIFVAPPTFSNSKRMEGTFDVQRDHEALLRAAAALLEPGGVLVFSNHYRRFRMAEEVLREMVVEEITRQTIPQDFARDPRIHNSWRLMRREG